MNRVSQQYDESSRWKNTPIAEKLGFIDLVIERTDTRAPHLSDSYRTALIFESSTCRSRAGLPIHLRPGFRRNTLCVRAGGHRA